MELYVKVVASYIVILQVAYGLSWLRVRWWKWSIGRAYFFKTWALAAVFAVLVIGWWWHVPDAVWAVLVTLLAFGLTTVVAVSWREQRNGERNAALRP